MDTSKKNAKRCNFTPKIQRFTWVSVVWTWCSVLVNAVSWDKWEYLNFGKNKVTRFWWSAIKAWKWFYLHLVCFDVLFFWSEGTLTSPVDHQSSMCLGIIPLLNSLGTISASNLGLHMPFFFKCFTTQIHFLWER